MPALLVHMTLIKQTLKLAEVPSWVKEAAIRAEPELILGAVLPDLPYHARFLHQVVRHLRKKEYLHFDWGDVFHTKGTGQLPFALLRHHRRSQLSTCQEAQTLALVAGYLSHYAADQMVHPVVNQLVTTQKKTSPLPSSVLHSQWERYQNIFFHQDLIGQEIFCSPVPRQLVRQMAGAGLVRPMINGPVWEAIRAACLETHGRAPSAPELRDWLWGITMYGHLMSSPLGRGECLKGDPQELRRLHYQGPEVDLHSPLIRAMNHTVTLWQAATHVLRAERITHEIRESFLDKVRDINMGTGA